MRFEPARHIFWIGLVATLVVLLVLGTWGQTNTFCPLNLPCTWTALNTFIAGLTVSGSPADMSSSTVSKLRVAPSLATSTNGDIGFDSTSNNWHVWNGSDLVLSPLAPGFVSGDCGEPTNSGGSWKTVDAGGPCNTGSVGTFYQTVQSNGVSVTQRPKLNMVSGTGATVSCVDNSGQSRTDCTVTVTSTAMPSVRAYNNCAMTGNLIVNSTSVTPVVTCTLVTPSSGCPCRAQFNWAVTVDLTNNNHINFWVTDGTATYRGSPVFGQTSDETGSSGSGMSSTAYGNNTTVTFTLNTQGAGSPNYTVKATPSVGGANSGMDVSIFTSN